MTHIPIGQLAWENVTTTEQLSGRTIDGAASYVKLVRRSLPTGTGDLNIAHGIVGLTRVVTMRVGIKDNTPQWFTIPIGTISSGANNFGLSASIDSTNVILHIGASWAVANALSEVYAILEYLK
jgi:hypothetical protein